MRRSVAFWVALVVVLLASWPSRSLAAALGDLDAETLVRRGEDDEREGAFARAVADDRAAIAASPGSRWAERAAARLGWLEARSEGDFAPLARLQRVRADALALGDAQALEALSRDADAFPPGRVRGEARMVVAHAWLRTPNGADRARVELLKVAGDPRAEPVVVRLATRELVDSLLADGRLEQARREALARADALDPRFVVQVVRIARRPTLAFAASLVLALFFARVATAAWRRRDPEGLRRIGRALCRVAPTTALMAGAIAAGGPIASAYEQAQAAPFVGLAIAILPIGMAAGVWNASGSTRLASRLGRALGSVASVAAAAFLALFHSGSTYLEGFGL